MRHHAFVIAAEKEEGIACAKEWLISELGIELEKNPDIRILEYGLLSVEDARKIADIAASAPFRGEHKAVIISADRAYHEAQNALLKLFEEPPPGTYLFLILPSLGGLLPTLRSRVQELKKTENKKQKAVLPEIAEEFLKGSKEKRSALIKRLTSGKDEDEKRELREEAIELVNGVEAALVENGLEKQGENLKEIAILRGYFYDRSAPVKIILEHLSLVVPRNLL